jgi:hypothetical protein
MIAPNIARGKRRRASWRPALLAQAGRESVAREGAALTHSLKES